jgi:hypothetical protein
MKYLVKVGMTCLLAAAANAAEPAAPPVTEAAEAKPAAQPAEDLSATAQPRVRTSPNAQPAGSARDATKDKPVGPDRLQLDTTIVTGNRELPKVLYIVPWKKADIGELPSQPFNSLLDEALTPLDRDVFRREVSYFGVITGQAAEAASVPTAEQQAAPAKK